MMFENNKELTTLDRYKKLYGFYEGNLNYIPKGGELQKYVGNKVVMIDYFKDEAGKWDYNLKEATIESITDYDAMTVTSKIKYKVTGEDESKEIRIIPEGFSFENPEEVGKSIRFLPFSMHFKVQEEKYFYEMLFKKFDTAETLSIEAMENIANSKEQNEILGRNYNIIAAIKTDEERPEMLYFRIDKLKIKHSKQDKYVLTIATLEKDKTYTFMINKDEKFYNFTYGKERIGDLKIIDLGKLS